MSAPLVRCMNAYCRTAVDLDDDPAALCDRCRDVTCDRCEHVCETDR